MSYYPRRIPWCIKNISKSELDIFEIPPLDTSNEKGWWSYYEATNLTKCQSEIIINVPANECYTDLSGCSLYVKCRVYEESDRNKELDNNCKVGPVNNFLHSLFSQIELSFNGQSFENSNNEYPYKAYITDLLNYGQDSKNSY